MFITYAGLTLIDKGVSRTAKKKLKMLTLWTPFHVQNWLPI